MYYTGYCSFWIYSSACPAQIIFQIFFLDGTTFWRPSFCAKWTSVPRLLNSSHLFPKSKSILKQNRVTLAINFNTQVKNKYKVVCGILLFVTDLYFFSPSHTVSVKVLKEHYPDIHMSFVVVCSFFSLWNCKKYHCSYISEV